MFGCYCFWSLYVFQVFEGGVNYVYWIGGVIVFGQNVLYISYFQNGMYGVVGDDVGIF